jgi:hypothetical protein
MYRIILAVVALLAMASPSQASHFGFNAFHRNFFNRAFYGGGVLAPSFGAYSVPVTYSYASAIPTGVVQSTWTVTQPQIAASVGAPAEFSTEYLVQQPVQVQAAYLAPQVTYSSPLFYGATSYATGAGYGAPLFFDRGILGVNYNRFGFNRFNGLGFNGLGFRSGLVGGLGGNAVSVNVNERRGLFGLRRSNVNVQAVSTAGANAVNVNVRRGRR